MRNILSKLPRMMQPKMKAPVHQVFRTPSYSVALERGRNLIGRFKDRYTAAMECLERDLESAAPSEPANRNRCLGWQRGRGLTERGFLPPMSHLRLISRIT
jgi:hypothetical protein